MIENLNNKPGDYNEKYIKIKFIQMIICLWIKYLKLHNLTVIVRSVFQEENKYYP